MWPALFATLATIGLTDTENPQSAEPDAPRALSAAEKLLAEHSPEPQYAQRGVPLPTASALGAFRSPGWGSLDADSFRGGMFATPLPGRVVVPEGARLAAPVITPSMKHGKLAYNVTPTGRVDVFDPVATRHPEDFVFGPASEPVPWKVWGSTEFLLGTTRAANVPPVVTTGPAALGIGTAGAFGQPGTAPLFGGGKMLDDWRTGFRAEMGVWFDDAQVWGFAGRYYSLYSTSDQIAAGGNGTNVIAVPQVLSAGPVTVQVPGYVAFPGVVNGSVSTTAQTNFAGGDLSVRRMLRQGPGWRLEALAGYRQLHLGDELGLGFRFAPGATGFGPLVLAGSDSLRTRNNFYGAHLGGIASATLGRWSFEGLGAVALGLNASDLNNDRTRQLNIRFFSPFPLVSSSSAGVSVAESTSYFGTVWEGGLKVAYRAGDHLRLTMGYTGLSWWNLRRAQEQYDFRAGSVVTGSTTNTTTNFYAHVLSWGAELRY